VATLIHQSDPLPKFCKARSMLTLEEANLAKKTAQSSSSAMVTRYSVDSHDIFYHFSSNRNTNDGKRNQTRNNNEGKKRNNNGGCGGGKWSTNEGGNASGPSDNDNSRGGVRLTTATTVVVGSRSAPSSQCSMVWQAVVALNGTLGSLAYTSLSISF